MRMLRWNAERKKQDRSVADVLCRILYWTVLTALWFLMVSTCTQTQLTLDGASVPTDQYHGW